MPKFYVQSGSIRSIVDSQDAERAALWCVHVAMDQVFPMDDCDEPNEADIASVLDHEIESTASLSQQPARPLGTSILVSEIGFDREDALRFSTKEVFQQWYELVQAIERLSALM